MAEVKIEATVKGEAQFVITICKADGEVDIKTVRFDSKEKCGSTVVGDGTPTTSNVLSDCVDAGHDRQQSSAQVMDTEDDEESDLPKDIPPVGEFTYDMNYRRRGLFVVFNHEKYDTRPNLPERKGTHIDKASLERVAKFLGFDFRVHDDLQRKCLLRQIEEYGKMDHSNSDCFVCVILSHGTTNDRLYAYDDPYELKRITDQFKGDKCPSLARKPKLFITQACRGQTLDQGVTTKEYTCYGQDQPDAGPTEHFQKDDENISIPVAADFLFAHATPADYYAWRNSANGSIFIQVLCDCLITFGRQWDLLRVLTLVTNRVAQEFASHNTECKRFDAKKQIPSIISQLRGKIVFTQKPYQ